MRFKEAYNRFAALKSVKGGAYHLSAFLLLHEATAIIPLPIVYYALASSSIEAPAVAPEMLQEATVRMKKMLDRMDSTWTVSQQSANVLFHMASAYCIVKSLFPLRIALSVALTPTIAKLMQNVASKAFKRYNGT